MESVSFGHGAFLPETLLARSFYVFSAVVYGLVAFSIVDFPNHTPVEPLSSGNTALFCGTSNLDTEKISVHLFRGRSTTDVKTTKPIEIEFNICFSYDF